MLIYIDYIMEYVNNIKKDDSILKPNGQAFDGVIYKFIQLREESTNLSEEFLNNHPSIQRNVRLLNCFRNCLMYDYDNDSYTFLMKLLSLLSLN